MGEGDIEFDVMADDLDVAAWMQAEDDANYRWLLAAVFEHRPTAPGD